MERNEYTAVAKSLHWFIAALIFVQFPLGWIMDDLTGVQKFKAFNFHKSLGLVVLALTLVRLIWRVLNPAPALPASMPRLERTGAHLGHIGLYLMIVVVTMSGWAAISVSKFPSIFFGTAPIPKLPWLADLPSDSLKTYGDALGVAHWAGGLLLLALIAVHVAAALRHAIVLKDGVFSRMMPRSRAKSAQVAVLAAALGLGGLSLDGKASATEWSVNAAKSQIAFEASGGGSTTKGAFKQYRAEIEFDPDAPEQTSVRVLLNMNSAATDSADADDTLKSADFFNPAQFPTAQYVAKGAKKSADGKYILQGQLTLKGVTKPVAVPFSIDIKSGTAAVKAELGINRLDFGVGPESLAGLVIDKNVKLTIELTALRLDN